MKCYTSVTICKANFTITKHIFVQYRNVTMLQMMITLTVCYSLILIEMKVFRYVVVVAE